MRTAVRDADSRTPFRVAGGSPPPLHRARFPGQVRLWGACFGSNDPGQAVLPKTSSVSCNLQPATCNLQLATCNLKKDGGSPTLPGRCRTTPNSRP